MNWTEIEIYTSTEGVDILCAYLMDIGIKGFSIRDSQDFNEFLENKDGKWDYIDDDLMELKNCETSVTIYIPDNNQGAETFVSLKKLLEKIKKEDNERIFGRLEIKSLSIKEEDWANNWKQYFKPLKVGKKFLVKPSWEKYEDFEGRTILEIDPASSFGTGQHNTTKLCLEFLENAVSENDKVLDIGCGSGILSIGALLIGARLAVAVDIEENSVSIAKENAAKNNIPSEKYHVYCGNIVTDESLVNKIGGEYDVISANIVADVLISMKNLFKSFLKKKWQVDNFWNYY